VPARFSSGVLASVSGSQDYFSRWRFSIPGLGAGGPSCSRGTAAQARALVPVTVFFSVFDFLARLSLA
jgi:hypothetical protein